MQSVLNDERTKNGQEKETISDGTGRDSRKCVRERKGFEFEGER